MAINLSVSLWQVSGLTMTPEELAARSVMTKVGQAGRPVSLEFKESLHVLFANAMGQVRRGGTRPDPHPPPPLPSPPCRSLLSRSAAWVCSRSQLADQLEAPAGDPRVCSDLTVCERTRP